MPTRPKLGEEQTEDKGQASTPQLDRLEKLANAAATSAQAKRWKARNNGMDQEVEQSEVRNLSHNAEARAQAEAAMRQMMANPKAKRHR